ncbi:MAG TPA: Ig-like domain-containing protein [Micromonosporaceae bacterium]|jgi:lipoprotein-anchoring transpeptidase ErfK/SrfK
MGRRVWAALVVLSVAVPVALAGCTNGKAARLANGAASQAAAAKQVPPTLAITPPAGAKNLPVSTEIGTAVAGGHVTSVTLVDSAGTEIAGQLRADASSWVPSGPLRYDRRYSATVVATGADGQTATRTTTFTTMNEPGNRVGAGLYLFNGNTYGVAMPVVVEFSPGVPARYRAGVQKRLFVTTLPPQPGVWHWVENGTQAYYRAPEYWRPGTRLTVRVGLEGLPMGGGRYGDSDRRAAVTIGSKLALDIDNKTKQMKVYENGKLTRTMPVSLGKPSTPSSSGTMVIMDKQVTTVFDTTAELGPVEGYRVDIAYAQRLTWGGEFIHAAPWSVGDQGHRNVSHGCVNMSTPNATWLFGKTKIGDPVIVRGTEHRLEQGNGWTAWDMSWAEYIKGSALPVDVPAAAAQPEATPSQPTPAPTA